MSQHIHLDVDLPMKMPPYAVKILTTGILSSECLNLIHDRLRFISICTLSALSGCDPLSR